MKISKERMKKLKHLKKLIKSGKYNWDKAIENTADKIIKNPESLMWR